MPTEFKPMDDKDMPVTLREVEMLTGWPELAGYVIIGIARKLTPDGLPRVLMAADTSDPRQISKLLGTCSRQIREAGYGQ